MTGRKYLLDTNIIIYFLQGYEEVEPIFTRLEKGEVQGKISIITVIEVLAFPGLSDQKQQDVEVFIRNFEVVPLTDTIVKQTIRIRKQYKIKLPDAIIAATAQEEHAILATRNTKDFEHIADLEIKNPFDSSG